MDIIKSNLWNIIPGSCEEIPQITAYIPDNKTSSGAVVIFPGGGYKRRAEHEGDEYAHFFAENGIVSFVVDYRVSPHRFPCQLLDARRSVKFVRYHASEYGIDKSKIAVMGSSAGGHLAALCSTYFEDINCEVELDNIENEDCIPNVQILCYPVIKLVENGIAHTGSGQNLLGDKYACLAENLEPDKLISYKTPQAFIWHTSADREVNVCNSYEYAKSLKKHNIPVEMHIFPDGAHGMGLCDKERYASMGGKIPEHTGMWSQLLLTWLRYIGF